MLKIECCGLTSTQTKQIIDKAFPGQVETLVDPDMIAARLVKKGDVDFYLGSCLTGGGGSLATATAASQARSGKGLIRVANMVGATALCVPAPELGRGRVFLCQSQPEKIEKLLSSAGEAAQPEDSMLAWYFSKLDQYLKPGALPFQM